MKPGRALQVVVMLAVLAALLSARSYSLSRRTTPDRSAPAAPVGLYNPDPNDIWNRVHDSLLVRRGTDGGRYGSDTVDPLLWTNTTFLRGRKSQRRALESLDEFLRTHAEKAVTDPSKRAVFQHDFWAVFDWVASENLNGVDHALLVRLAQVMRRVALTPDQVRALPDTYSNALASGEFARVYDSANPQRAFLPSDLLREDGPWICLTGYLPNPTAIMHFSGRSRFLVFLRLPGGRQETLEYVQKLLDSSEPLFVKGAVPNGKMLNLSLPQFPVGTEVAMLRQMILIDADGNLVPTALTESVQVRVYHVVTPGSPYINYHNGPSSHDQDFFEFRFARPALFAGRSGGLRAVQLGETEYSAVFSFGIDAFEVSREDPMVGPREILGSCQACHADSGIHSVQSREQWLGQHQRNRGTRWEPLRAINWETDKTIERKQRQDNFTMLFRYWHSPG